VPALNSLAVQAFDANRTYGQVVHIVHAYVIEPHPQDPDPSPYSGVVWEAQYSSKRQPMTYAERVAAARDMLPFLVGQQIVLVDDLTPGARNNPVWCTYGPCPNCAYLIRQDGAIDSVQNWVDVLQMQSNIDRLLR
jgi:hypothetical protein